MSTDPAPVSLRALTIGLCMTVVAIAFEAIAVATAMPVAARELNGLSYYAWSFSLFLIGMLFATVVTGRLSDRIGPARPLLIGLGVFAVGLIVAGTASTMATLIGGRLIQGLGSGAMNTAAFVIIAQEFDARRRPRMFTYISTAWVLPAFVGPPVAAWLTRQLSWHWVFLAVLPLVVLGGGNRASDPAPADAGRIDLPGARLVGPARTAVGRRHRRRGRRRAAARRSAAGPVVRAAGRAGCRGAWRLACRG